MAAYRDALEGLFAGLPQVGFAARDVVRTWFLFDDVLADYAGFNAVRREAFERHGVLPGPAPGQHRHPGRAGQW
jgi:hypothetical protein